MGVLQTEIGHQHLHALTSQRLVAGADFFTRGFVDDVHDVAVHSGLQVGEGVSVHNHVHA